MILHSNLVFARVGDLSLKSLNHGLTASDIQVEDFIRHEQYNRFLKENDIALAKLSKPISFSKFIRPACLWQERQIPEAKVVATGWGLTEFGGSTSSDLLKVQLDLVAIEKCKATFDEDDGVIDGRQICAGDLGGGHDTCQGGEWVESFSAVSS